MTKVLGETVERLRKDGVSTYDIVILSPRRLENSALASVEQVGDIPLGDSSRTLEVAGECMTYSTVHSFKSLESRVVIIVDIDDVEDPRSQSLLYVGRARARALLILMAHERARRSIDRRIITAPAR